MRRISLWIIPACAALLATVSSVSMGDPSVTPTTPLLREPMVALERTQCKGRCPAYTLQVFDDGQVIYEGLAWVRVAGVQRKTISSKQIQSLTAAFDKAKFFSLKDSYEDEQITDSPSAFISFSLHGKKKKVAHYDGDPSAPKALTELEDRIDDIVGTAEWVEVKPSQSYGIEYPQ